MFLSQRDVELKHPGELICHHTASSLPNSSVPDKATSGYPIRTNQLHEVRSGGKEVNPQLYNIYQASSQRVPDNNQETSNVCSILPYNLHLLKVLFYVSECSLLLL